MRKKDLLLSLLAFIIFFQALMAQNYEGDHLIIDVKDYGAIPNDGKDDTQALRNAVKKCRTTENSILFLAPGRYLLTDPKAVQIQEDALAGKLGANPQDQLYRPGHDYVIGLDFNGAKNIQIKGQGAEIMCDGWMEPLSFRNCKDILVQGLRIDYLHPANSVGTIIAVEEDHVDVHFPESDQVSNELLMLRLMIFDDKSQSYTGPAVYHRSKELIKPQTIRFKGEQLVKQAQVGNKMIVFSGFHYRPAILIYKTRNIQLDDVTIHAQAGMGIVGHLSENIEMNRLKVIPRTGRYVSSNTDATHFATNRGLISFDQCEFAGQGDDATNVHTYYWHINAIKRSEKLCTIDLGKNNYTHSSYLDEPQKGDVLAVINKKTLEEIGEIVVTDFTLDRDKQKVIINYSGELSQDINHVLLANITACPSLRFVNSKVKYHRARSVLVKTRKVLIENNSFENTTGTAIHIGAEGDWGEGVTSEDVIVRNNTFTNCGVGGSNDGTIEGASAVAIHIKAEKKDVPGLHKRILIEGNIINGGERGIVIKSASDVLVSNNVFNDILEQAVYQNWSKRVKVVNNVGAKDFGLNQKVSPPKSSLWEE